MNPLWLPIRNLSTSVRKLPPNMKLFLVNVFAYGAAVEGISQVLLNLYLLRLGYGTEFIGTLNSAGLLVFAFVSLPIGAVQRFSSRQMMQLGQVMSLLGLVGIPLAYYVTAGQGILLIAFRVIGMIGLSAYFVHQIPYAMEITRPSWHDRALAATMAVFSLSAFAGSWIGGLLPEGLAWLSGLSINDPRPFQWSMLLATVVILPAMVAFASIRDGEKIGYSDESDVAAWPQVNGWRAIAGLAVLILLIRALQTHGVGIVNTFFNVYFDEALGMPTGQIGLVSGLGRLLGVPMSLTIPWLVGRYGNFKLAIASLILIVLLIIPMALIPNWTVASLALITINSMGSLRYLSFLAFTMALVSEKQRSLISGVGEMAIGTGFALSSFVGGYLIAWFGYQVLFLYGAGLTLVGIIVFWLVFHRRESVLKKAVLSGNPDRA